MLRRPLRKSCRHFYEQPLRLKRNAVTRSVEKRFLSICCGTSKPATWHYNRKLKPWKSLLPRHPLDCYENDGVNTFRRSVVPLRYDKDRPFLAVLLRM